MTNKEVFITSAPKFPIETLQLIAGEFRNKIGQGGYGVVYKGELDGRYVAVKLLHNHPAFGSNFEECINLMDLQHPNIIQLIGYWFDVQKVPVVHNGKSVFADEEKKALCLEYIEGGSLDLYISGEPCTLNWCVCYGIIKGICEGLKYLHTGTKDHSTLYHMDLKPENILLDNNIPKLCDFGLSRSGLSKTHVTQVLKGTPRYMPPERIDRGEIDHTYDIYSLGVIILEIVAGKDRCFRSPGTPAKKFIETVQGLWEKRTQETISSDESWEIKTCIKIALRCVRKNRKKRPTIAMIVDKLNKTDTAESSSTSKVTDFQSMQDDSSDNYEDEEEPNDETSALVDPSNSSSGQLAMLSRRNPLPHMDVQGSTELTNHSINPNNRANKARGPFSIQRIMCRRDTMWGMGVSVVFYVMLLYFLIFRYVFIPEVTAYIEDARLNSFALSTTAAASFLEYNISVDISVGTANVLMGIVYTKPLVSTIAFQHQRLYYNSTFTYEGQKQPRSSSEVYILSACGKRRSDVLGAAAVDEFKKQHAAGMFNLEVRLSGEITPGISDTRKFCLSCPLWLPLAPPPPVMLEFSRVHCVPMDLGENYFSRCSA